MASIKNLIRFSEVLIAAILAGCGEGMIDVSSADYQPKIVIDGYIFPGQKVENIKITRNIPLNTNIDVSGIILFNAEVTITDLTANTIYPLSFNYNKLYFEDAGGRLKIENGKSYKIDVKAKIDDKILHAGSVTTVPLSGLSLAAKDLGQLKYREPDAYGNQKKFTLTFKPSPDAAFHSFTITAYDTAVNNFIYDNPYHKFDSTQVFENMDSFRHSFSWLQNTRPGADMLTYQVEWLDIWFYGNYRLIVYAGDQNFKDFILTHNSVMEMDGNFHEPKLHIDGDGIGVFGSAVSDTVYFKVIK